MIHVCVVASDGPTDPPASTRDSKIEVCGKPSNVQPGVSSKEAQFITRNACMQNDGDGKTISTALTRAVEQLKINL